VYGPPGTATGGRLPWFTFTRTVAVFDFVGLLSSTTVSFASYAPNAGYA